MEELVLCDAWRVELDELSALAVRPPRHDSPAQLVCVGDEDFAIAVGEAQPPGTSQVQTLPLESGSSQWEGVAVDRDGQVLVLEEHAGKREPSHVFVFDPGLGRPKPIALRVDGDAEWEKEWRDHKNARGEAIALLDDGRLLIAKQKDPIRLIEFGPADRRAATGDGPSFLPPEEPFVLPDEDPLDYRPLRSWGIREVDEDGLDSINDLAVANGVLHAVSRSSRVVVQLAIDRESFGIQRSWRVPAVVGSPEGLAIWGGVIVADDFEADGDGARPNVFRLLREPR